MHGQRGHCTRNASRIRERIRLAKHLNSCSDVMRVFTYGPWDIRLANRILREQAGKTSQVVQDLAYPALLGSGQDLKLIKCRLGQMTYMISANNWVGIASAIPTDNRYERVKGVKLESGLQAINYLFLALAAIPGVPVLIGAFRVIFR